MAASLLSVTRRAKGGGQKSSLHITAVTSLTLDVRKKIYEGEHFNHSNATSVSFNLTNDTYAALSMFVANGHGTS